MVDSARHQRLNLPVAPLVAAVIGGVVALVFALVPSGLLEDILIDSGIAAVVPAAEPPLGLTARALLILAGGGGTALIAWLGLLLLLGDRAIVVQKTGKGGNDDEAPVLRRADAHPDAPARRPLSANRELGTPFLEVRAQRPVHARAEESGVETDEAVAERDLPDDLDTPLAAFDPHAIPPEPIDWLPQPAPLLREPRRQMFDPGERFETFALTPMGRSTAPAFEPEPEPAYAPIAAPEPMPAFAPARESTPIYAPVPIAAPEPMPAFAPTPARQPAQMFRSHRPLRPQRPDESERAFAPARPHGSAQVQMDPSASIHALLDRLERGVGRSETAAPPPPPPPQHEESLQQALVTLRRLAAQG